MTMKINKFIFSAWAMLSLVACSNDDIKLEQPTTGYRLVFDGGVGTDNQTRAFWSDPQGRGDLTFNWDFTPENEEGNEMLMVLHKMAFVETIAGEYFTYANINPHVLFPEDAHWAMFETVGEYESPLSSGDYDGHYLMGLTPFNNENEACIDYCEEDEFTATLPMPCTFEQNEDQQPDFLRNYMYMYTYRIISGGATLSFYHIPATFRFKIVNNRPETARINSVKVTVVDVDGMEQPVASQYVALNLTAGTILPQIDYSAETYTEVTTNINTDLTTGELFTAYALVLPLDGNVPLQGKKIRFTIDASNPDNEHLSFELDAETLANANRGIYNWKAGKSYTINMKLDDMLYFDDITVTGWEEEFGGWLETE